MEGTEMKPSSTTSAIVMDLQDRAEYQPLLTGGPVTFGMRSGRVYLKPGETCGEHTTGQHEEMLVFLRGGGTAIINRTERLSVGQGKISYIPPHTIHNIENTGEAALVYIYCVAPVSGDCRDDKAESGHEHEEGGAHHHSH